MSYNGGKGNSYHKIINRIPPHRVYIEPFLGGGAVMRKKRPAKINIGLDLDLSVLRATAWSRPWPAGGLRLSSTCASQLCDTMVPKCRTQASSRRCASSNTTALISGSGPESPLPAKKSA